MTNQRILFNERIGEGSIGFVVGLLFHAGIGVPVAYAMGLVASCGITSRRRSFPTHGPSVVPYGVDDVT